MLMSYLLDTTSRWFALGTSRGKVQPKLNRLRYICFLEAKALRDVEVVLVTSKTQNIASFVLRRSQEAILAIIIAWCQTP